MVSQLWIVTPCEFSRNMVMFGVSGMRYLLCGHTANFCTEGYNIQQKILRPLKNNSHGFNSINYKVWLRLNVYCLVKFFFKDVNFILWPYQQKMDNSIVNVSCQIKFLAMRAG